jgi:hypothetical protein
MEGLARKMPVAEWQRLPLGAMVSLRLPCRTHAFGGGYFFTSTLL